MKGNAQIDGKEVKVGSGYGKTPVVLASGKNVIALSRTGECTIEGVTSNVKVEDINDLLKQFRMTLRWIYSLLSAMKVIILQNWAEHTKCLQVMK